MEVKAKKAIVAMVDTKELETLDMLHYSPVDVPVVHDNLLCFAHIEGEVVVLAPHYQVSDLLPIGCLIVVDDQAYHCCVRPANLMMMLELCFATQ